MIGDRMLREGDHRDILSLFIGSVRTAQASSRALRTALYNQVLYCALTLYFGIVECKSSIRYNILHIKLYIRYNVQYTIYTISMHYAVYSTQYTQ